MTVEEITAVNGQSDDMEPWTVADDLDTIDIGDDIIAIADDGVVRWCNSDRVWSEIEPGSLRDTLDSITDLADRLRVVDCIVDNWEGITRTDWRWAHLIPE
jgi:hypothetical protein